MLNIGLYALNLPLKLSECTIGEAYIPECDLFGQP